MKLFEAPRGGTEMNILIETGAIVHPAAATTENCTVMKILKITHA